jgi:hypothetical protein
LNLNFVDDNGVYMDGPSQLNPVVLGRIPNQEAALKISLLPNLSWMGASSGTFHSAVCSKGMSWYAQY